VARADRQNVPTRFLRTTTALRSPRTGCNNVTCRWKRENRNAMRFLRTTGYLALERGQHKRSRDPSGVQHQATFDRIFSKSAGTLPGYARADRHHLCERRPSAYRMDASNNFDGTVFPVTRNEEFPSRCMGLLWCSPKTAGSQAGPTTMTVSSPGASRWRHVS